MPSDQETAIAPFQTSRTGASVTRRVMLEAMHAFWRFSDPSRLRELLVSSRILPGIDRDALVRAFTLWSSFGPPRCVEETSVAVIPTFFAVPLVFPADPPASLTDAEAEGLVSALDHSDEFPCYPGGVCVVARLFDPWSVPVHAWDVRALFAGLLDRAAGSGWLPVVHGDLADLLPCPSPAPRGTGLSGLRFVLGVALRLNGHSLFSSGSARDPGRLYFRKLAQANEGDADRCGNACQGLWKDDFLSAFGGRISHSGVRVLDPLSTYLATIDYAVSQLSLTGLVLAANKAVASTNGVVTALIRGSPDAGDNVRIAFLGDGREELAYADWLGVPGTGYGSLLHALRAISSSSRVVLDQSLAFLATSLV